MRRFFSGLVIALVALSTVQGQADADQASDRATLTGTHVLAMLHIDGGFVGFDSDNLLFKQPSLKHAVKACHHKPRCIRHARNLHARLLAVWQTREPVWLALKDELPLCADETSVDCYYPGGDSPLKWINLDGLKYYYELS